MTQQLKSETIVFNGVKFRRYPESKHLHLRSYFYPSGNYQKRGIQALHIEIWKAVHGEVPAGYHIHHIDGNTLNNSIENLECISPKEHMQEHFSRPERLEKAREHIENIRPLAIAWHKSEKAKKFHIKHGKEVFRNLPTYEKICEVCGKSFQTVFPNKSRFCGNNCKATFRRKAKVDTVIRQCKKCKNEFECNRYSKSEHCSRLCQAATRWGK